MARVPLTFKERDVKAAIKAVERAGHKVARVLIGKDGQIIVELALPGGSATAPDHAENPWDRVLK